MKNNIRAVVFHIFAVVFVFLFSLLINANETIRGIVYSHIFFRLLAVFFVIMFYYNLGKGMNKRRNRKFDYFTGIFIIFISVVLGIVSFAGLGKEVFSVPVAASMWRFPLDVFLMPEMYILEVFNIKHNIVTYILSMIFPSLIFGISIRNSRRKMAKQKRIRRIQNQKRKRQLSQSGNR